MRPGIIIDVTAADRDRLAAVVADRNSAQKHAWRAAIVLATADGLGTNAIMRQTGKSKTAVWRWQERFASEGVDGLLRDKTRPSRVAPFGPEVGERIVALTLAEPPGETTQWTGRAMAKVVGVSLSYVQRIWRSHGLQPHRIRTFKLSNDPAFAAKVRDIVGLYVDPPAHAVVLSLDEKSQIQALDRTQPGLPLKKGRAGTMTHDYKRHGTTTLFAALDVLDGKVSAAACNVIGIRSSSASSTPSRRPSRPRKAMHVILDNYAAHKHPKVIAWLARHPRVTFHFTPTSASWLNAVEGFFAALTKRRLRRGAFLGVVDLQAAINRYLAEHNVDPKPVPLESRPRHHHRRSSTRAPDVGFNPLVGCGNAACSPGDFPLLRRALTSITIWSAISSIAPTATLCHQDCRPTKIRPALRTPMVATPMAMPTGRPAPPEPRRPISPPSARRART